MTSTVEIPFWLLVLILLFATVTFASHFLFPSVRWFFRRRLEKAVARVNARLDRPIEPFRLARRYDMIQRLIYDPEVTQAIVDHAKAEGVPENVAFESAQRYAREIVPSFSASLYFSFAIRAARFVSNALYRVRLGHHDEAALKAIDPDATVIFVINHRSNMDYVLVTYLAADRSALSYAVGEWARVWPLSGLIRSLGGYFIRRRSRNDLYRRVLARYIRMSTNGGVTQAIFPEGGLSLDGALKAPKLGLLKYIADAAADGDRDIVFVPVALNYDRVLEDRVLIEADHSGGRKFRAKITVIFRFAFKQLWLRVTGRFHRFGYAAVSFGKPVSLKEFAKTQTGDLARPLGRALIERIGAIVPVLPVPLIAWVLQEKGALSRSNVEKAVELIMEQVPEAHVHVPREDRAYAVEVGLRNMIERRMIDEVEGLYMINESKADTVHYYANSIRHLMDPNQPIPFD
jgi:glycerol-3-phosphate O-acyltransferase